MDEKQFRLRSRLLLIFLAVILLLFTVVLYGLQVVDGAHYLEQSSRKIANTETVEGDRGDILDRYGRVLATNRATYQVTLNSKLLGEAERRNEILLDLLAICREQGVEWEDTLPVTAAPPFSYTTDTPFRWTSTDENGVTTTHTTQLGRLMEALNLSPLTGDPTAEELVESLRAYFEIDPSVGEGEGRALAGVLYEMTLRSKDVARVSYVFAQDVDIAFITAVKERRLTGVSIDTVTVREYATDSAAHLLGQVGPIYAEEWDYYRELGYSMNDIVGKDGVEAAFEDILRGTPGTRDIELSQSGKIVSESWHVNAETGEVEVPRPGENIMLTVDLKLQEVVEQALARHAPDMSEDVEGAACVVVDMTGGVLASASYPDFDPTTYSRDYNDLLADPLKPLFNRALQGLYAPGSTFKPAVAAGALEEGVITTTEEIYDTGRYRRYSRIEDQPMCWYFRQYGGSHGYVNVSEAIRDSCNVFFYETGLRLTIEKLDAYAALFGFGQKTGLELYEEAGAVAGPETSERYGQTWYEGNTMYAAIGQGDTQVTPIQLANYTATLVNGGYRYPTHLLKTVKSSDFSTIIEEYEPVPLSEIGLDEANLEAVKKGMGMLVTEGSISYYFRDLGVTAGAKTGTAQVSNNSEANALLIAFAPYDDPEIALSVVVEKGGSGSLVAAIAAEVFDYYFSTKDAMDAAPTENTLIR